MIKYRVVWETSSTKHTFEETVRMRVLGRLLDLLAEPELEKITVTVVKDGGQHGNDSSERKDGA